MNIRKLVYLVKDYFQGSPFKNNLLDLEAQFEFGFAEQAKRIKEIIHYSILNTRHYKFYEGYEEFESLPVLDKNTIKENYEDFISFEYKNKLETLHKVTTSGSYALCVSLVVA